MSYSQGWFEADSNGIIVYKALNLEMTGMVTHGFSTRRGGISESPKDTLNLGFHVDDNPKCVLENRHRLLSALELDLKSAVCAEQVHGNKVALVTASDASRGAEEFSNSMPGFDALITNSPNITLMLFFADCVPVFILDPVNKAIGLAHAGWKGTALRIGAETVRAMQESFGTDPANCIAAIGPAIGRCCYDVSPDVESKVCKASGDDRVIARACSEVGRVDLKLANWFILANSGIPEKNISISNLCTSCQAEDFFSYRRDGATGRMAAVLALR